MFVDVGVSVFKLPLSDSSDNALYLYCERFLDERVSVCVLT